MQHRYVIIGAGAIGGTVGGVLTRAGVPAVLVARGRHAEVLAADGLMLRTPDGTFPTAVTTASRPEDVELTDRDVLIFATKTQQLEAALQEWADRPVYDQDGVVGTAGERVPAMTALNGVAAEEKSLRYFRRVFGICVWMPAVHVEPGEVIVQSWPVAGQFHIARWPASSSTQEDAALLAGLAESWGPAGILVSLPDDVAPWKYNKLLSNLGNAVGALTREAADAGEDDHRGAQRRRKSVAARGNRIRLVRDVHGGPDGRTNHTPDTRLGPRTEQLHLAVLEPQHRQRGNGLPERRDRPDRAPARPHGATQRGVGASGACGPPRRPGAG